MRKCCNCGGDHTAAYGGCPARRKAVVVPQVRTAKNLSYAEAVKEVEKESKEKEKSQSSVQGETMIKSERLVLFIAYVINCTEQAKNRTEKIKIIVKAAARFLNLRNLSWEKISAELSKIGEPPETISSSPWVNQD